MTRALPFPKPECFVDGSKSGNMIVLVGVSKSFLLSSVLSLLLDVGFLIAEVYYWSAVISVSFRSTFMSALITRLFAVEWSVMPVLTYLRKPMLATRCVDNLLTFTHVRRNLILDIILWLPYFIAETFNVEWRS